MSERVLVIAAHPDDEVLGCGGTIARHASNGDLVNIFIVAEGATSRDRIRSKKRRLSQINALQRAAIRAAAILGAGKPGFGGLPDNRLDSVPLLDVVKRIESVMAKTTPSIVYTHHGGDLNIDHRIVHQSVVTACRPVPGQPVKRLLFFETASSTEWQIPGVMHPFAPTWFVDISSTLPKKLRALKAYESEMRPWPHARSVEAIEVLAKHRGASAGRQSCEAFILGRAIE